MKRMALITIIMAAACTGRARSVTGASARPLSQILAEGIFTPVSGIHSIQGRVTINREQNGIELSLSSDFKVSRGPALAVVLRDSHDVNVMKIVAPLQELQGSQNYRISLNSLQLANFDEVVIYCTKYHVNFGMAKLVPTAQANSGTVNPDIPVTCQDFGSELITDKNGNGNYFCSPPFYTTPNPKDPGNPNDVSWFYLTDPTTGQSKDYNIQVCQDGHVILESDAEDSETIGGLSVPPSYYVLTSYNTGGIEHYGIAHPSMYQGNYVDPFLAGLSVIVIHNADGVVSTSIKARYHGQTYARYRFGCDNGLPGYGGSNYEGPANF